ncbi:MAG TPA: hypothetical protein VFU09_09095 [Candidatus Udaeobacter sp.]|jgi:hypothetical protein|nr:hypothetical protein [Candidatus Udaeobacter sp.]
MSVRVFLALNLALTACSPTHPKHSSPCIPAAMASYPWDRGGGLKHDPQEDDPRLRKVFEDAYAERMTANGPPRLGEIHKCRRYEKEFLLRKYGIRWRDPSEMNPGVAFD